MGLWEWMVQNRDTLLWLVVAMGLLTLEAFTTQMVSIWFSIGALAALIGSRVGLAPWAQFLLFVGVSAAMLLLTRPLVRDVLKVKKIPTNADSIIGQTALVTQRVDNLAGEGRVLVGDIPWTARSLGEDPIPQGQKVIIREIQGVKVLVEPLQEE